MNPGGDAAEQVVRMSLEGVEVIARISGEETRQLAILIAAVLREEQKTHGKARLTNMIKSGNELKVFTVQQKDLKKFAQEAKRYGVLYSVLREKRNNDPNAAVDVIARASDAPKISRIVERFSLSTVEKASVVGGPSERNPVQAKAGKEPQSLQNSREVGDTHTDNRKKPSVKAEIERYRQEQKGPRGAASPRRDLPGGADVHRPDAKTQSVKIPVKSDGKER